MYKRAVIAVVCIISLFTFSCASVGDKAYSLEESDEPEEYSPEEFPQWLNDLRRAEIIFFGSIPFTVLLTNLGYGIYQTVASGVGGSYSIENFTQTTSMTNEDRYKVLGISAGLSAGIALTDYIIGLFENSGDDE